MPVKNQKAILPVSLVLILGFRQIMKRIKESEWKTHLPE
jgi:hypothetical protein